jgi:hypothetical protein
MEQRGQFTGHGTQGVLSLEWEPWDGQWATPLWQDWTAEGALLSPSAKPGVRQMAKTTASTDLIPQTFTELLGNSNDFVGSRRTSWKAPSYCNPAFLGGHSTQARGSRGVASITPPRRSNSNVQHWSSILRSISRPRRTRLLVAVKDNPSRSATSTKGIPRNSWSSIGSR